MYQKLGLTDLVSAIQIKVNEKTGLSCYDEMSLDATRPFYFVEVVQKKSANTKTMLRETFNVDIHIISEPSSKLERIYKLIQMVEEALSENIELPNAFELIFQNEDGLKALKTEETKEKHAILSYKFMVCYGYKLK